jgi:alpha-beta hydrolase superfamily lysophospholipase
VYNVCTTQCKELTLPLLSLHGTSDNIAPMKAVKRLLEEAQSTDTKMHEFPGSYHEVRPH